MDTLTLSQADTRRLEKLAHEAGRTPNGHGEATTDDETRHARFPLPNPPPEGEGANVSLREFHVKDVLKHVLRDGFDATEYAIKAVNARMQSVARVPHGDAMQQLDSLIEGHAHNKKKAA